MNQRVENMRETQGIAEYVSYIKQRIKYLEIFAEDGSQPSMELKYYKALQSRIKEWGRSHRIAYRYIIGILKADEAAQYLGVSTKTFFRAIDKQRTEFIEFIQNAENELDIIYPFMPMEMDFEED